MAEKENKMVFESRDAVDSTLRCLCRKPKKPGFIDAICEVCEKVYETDKNVYICPDCLEKAK